jgi:hypothetical protein
LPGRHPLRPLHPEPGEVVGILLPGCPDWNTGL